MPNVAFQDERLEQFRHKIREESQILIDDIIEKNSPIQKGEDVKTISYGGETVILRVTKIELYAIDSWGCPGEILSFSYEGIPLKKDGTPMKHRTPIYFGAFIKAGKQYHIPSYFRIKITAAKMY